MKKLILEIEVEDFNTEGMEECLRDVGEPDTALVDYLQDDLMRREVALGLGAFLSDDWQIVGRTGHVVGARLSGTTKEPVALTRIPAPECPVGEDEPSDPAEGLPVELAAALREPGIVVPQDAQLWELLGRWANAPSNTVSAAPDATSKDKGEKR